MKEIIQKARKIKDLTQEQTARQMFMATRQYQRIEYGEQEMTPEQVVRLAEILNFHALTMVYCRKHCAIGKKYCFEILNNVDLSPMAILSKYRQEEREAHEALERMAELMLNKHGRDDCSEAELKDLHRWALEMLDLEHVIETLKLRLWDFMDVVELVGNHNSKCVTKRYYDPKKPELQLAG